jgi:hypothetical protein
VAHAIAFSKATSLRKIVLGVAGLCLVAQAGCGTGSAVTGRFPVGKAYDVNLGQTWSKLTPFTLNSKVKQLTIDGPLLNNFYLSEGLKVGQSIIRTPVKSRPMPVVKADMSETELAEFVVDTIAAFGYEGAAYSDLKPAKFGGVDAVRFNVAAKTDAGLDVSGTAQVALRQGEVHVMLFLAASEHYYPSLISEVNTVFGSATLRP